MSLRERIERGAVGGCCGIGVGHIRLLAERLAGRPVGSVGA